MSDENIAAEASFYAMQLLGAFDSDALARSIYGDAPGVSNQYWVEQFVAGEAGNNFRNQVNLGIQFRDDWMHRFSVLPSAVQSFVEVGTSREWVVTGKPRAAARALEKINRSYYVDSFGIKHHGFDNVLAVLAMDWLTVGRAFLWNRGERKDTPNSVRDLVYIDPQDISIEATSKNGVWWSYIHPFTNKSQKISQRDITFFDCIRFGRGGFTGRAQYALPAARLDWFLREHDLASLDGRKIKDIYFVADDSMVQSLEKALNNLISEARGDNQGKHNVGVVAINNRGGETIPIDQTFARLGLTEIPDNFDRAQFEMYYVNIIAAALGLSVRFFWNDPRGTNRSLEQVSQERQEVQGPAYFLRSVERAINKQGFIDSSKTSKALLRFHEETDTSVLTAKALAFKTYTEGFKLLHDIAAPLPQILTSDQRLEEVKRSPPSQLEVQKLLDLLSRNGLLSIDLTLPDMVVLEEAQQKDTLRGLASIDRSLDSGEVMMDANGRVLSRRQFSIAT